MPDEIAMPVTGHKDVKTFKGHHVARPSAQAEALKGYSEHLARLRAAQARS